MKKSQQSSNIPNCGTATCFRIKCAELLSLYNQKSNDSNHNMSILDYKGLG